LAEAVSLGYLAKRLPESPDGWKPVKPYLRVIAQPKD
jgi:hypothetical protein